MSRRRNILFLVGVLFSGACLWFSFRNTEFSRIVEEIASVHLGVLALAIVLKALNLVLATLRTQLLMRPIASISNFHVFKSLMLSFVVNYILPFRAGEVARIGYLSQQTKLPASSCLAVIAIERSADLFILAFIFLTMIPLVTTEVSLGTGLYVSGAVAATALLIAIYMSRRPERMIAWVTAASGIFGKKVQTFFSTRAETFAHGLTGLGSIFGVVSLVLITSALWFSACLGFELIILAFGLSLPWYSSVVILGFVMLGLTIPSTPGNIGTYHYAVSYALSVLGVGASTAGSFAIVAHGLSILPIVAAPFFLVGYIRKHVRRDSSSVNEK